MKAKEITVIDYGMGNLWSVKSALQYLGCDVNVSNDPKKIVSSGLLLLPGVGSFSKAMNSLQSKGMDEAIIEAVLNKGNKILGICLGMQLMGISSTEDGKTIGLGLISAPVDKFTQPEIGYNKVPHIGFDSVHYKSDAKLFKGLNQDADFYFIHSYRMLPAGLTGVASICEYGIKFLAAYEQDNIFATQFHPEKSQTNGLVLLKNFLNS